MLRVHPSQTQTNPWRHRTHRRRLREVAFPTGITTLVMLKSQYMTTLQTAWAPGSGRRKTSSPKPDLQTIRQRTKDNPTSLSCSRPRHYHTYYQMVWPSYWTGFTWASQSSHLSKPHNCFVKKSPTFCPCQHCPMRNCSQLEHLVRWSLHPQSGRVSSLGYSSRDHYPSIFSKRAIIIYSVWADSR